MAINRAEFQIVIDTKADTAALEKTISILERARETAAKAGQDTALYDAALEKNKATLAAAAKAHEKAGKAAEDAGKKMGEAFEIHGHTARHAIHLIGDAAGEIAPQLANISQLGAMAASPEFMVPAAALIAWKMLSEMMDKMVEQQQDIIEWNHRLKESAIEASEETIRGIKAEMAAFDVRLAHQFDGENQLAKALAQRLTSYDAEQAHENTLASTESARFEAYIAYLVKIGKLTPEQGEHATNASKQFDDDRKEKQEEKKAQLAIDAKKAEQAQARGQMEDDPSKLAAAEAAKKTAMTAAATNKKNIDQEKDRYAKLDADAKEVEERVTKVNLIKATLADPNASEFEKAAALSARLQNAVLNAARGGDEQTDETDAKRMRHAAEQQKGHVEKMEDHQGDLDDEVKKADANVKKWQDEIANATKSFKELTDAISEMTLALAQKKSDYKDTRAESQRTTQAKGFYSHHGPIDEETARFFNLPEQGGAVYAALDKVKKEVGSQVQANRYHQADPGAIAAATQHIVAIFASHAELTVEQNKKLLELERQLQTVQQQLQASRDTQH